MFQRETNTSLFLACFFFSLLVLFICTGGLQKTQFFCYHTKSRDKQKTNQFAHFVGVPQFFGQMSSLPASLED